MSAPIPFRVAVSNMFKDLALQGIEPTDGDKEYLVWLGMTNMDEFIHCSTSVAKEVEAAKHVSKSSDGRR